MTQPDARPSPRPSPRIVLLDREAIGPDVAMARPRAPHGWAEHDATPPDAVVERLAGARVAIVNKVPIGREALGALPELELIAVAATGYDTIDLAACRERGVTVSTVQGYAENTVPDHTMALILALSRSLPGYMAEVADGAWGRARQFCLFTHPIVDLAGRRLGVIGEGVIGQGVARRARAFGMEVVFAAHKGSRGMGPLYTPFDEVIETADVLTLHAPLTEATRGTLAMPEFRRMTRRPLIVNTARGGLVDEADLARALEEGLVGGIGFDVLTSEPPRQGNPLLALVGRPDVIVTPHVAWASREARQTVWDQVVEAVDAFLDGAPVRVVT